MSDNYQTDALVYSDFTNILTGSELTKLNISDLQGSDADLNLQKADQYLDETTIKRACCLGDKPTETSEYYRVNVRIPIPNDVQNFSNEYLKNLGAFDKTIYVHKSKCPADYKVDDNGVPKLKCDAFMKLYCQNMRKEFDKREKWSKESGTPFPYETWKSFKPECACYGELFHPTLKPASCYMPGCVIRTPGVYLDSENRNPECNLTFCNAASKIGEAIADQSSSINSNIIQKCGPQFAVADVKDTLKDTLSNNDELPPTGPPSGSPSGPPSGPPARPPTGSQDTTGSSSSESSNPMKYIASLEGISIIIIILLLCSSALGIIGFTDTKILAGLPVFMILSLCSIFTYRVMSKK